MKVVSVNIGEKRIVSYRGKNVWTGIFKEPVGKSIFLGKEDVLKDQVVDRRYHGGIDKACYIFSADCYDFWKTKYPSVSMNYGAFGENITLSGLDESKINIGTTYQIGSAIVEIAQPRQPCFKQGIRFGSQKIVKDFFNAPHPGIYLRVIEEGEVKVNDEMILLESREDAVSVQEVHSLFTYNKNNTLLGMKAINDPKLADGYKKDLIKIFSRINEK